MVVFFITNVLFSKPYQLKPKFHNVKVLVSIGKVSMNLNHRSWEGFCIILFIDGKLDLKQFMPTRQHSVKAITSSLIKPINPW